MLIKIYWWKEQDERWIHQRDENVDEEIINSVIDNPPTPVSGQYKIEIPDLQKVLLTVNPFLFDQAMITKKIT